MSPLRYTRFERRIPVAPTGDAEVVGQRFLALLADTPTHRVQLVGRFAIEYREEPPWYLAVSGIGLALMALMGALLTSRAGAHAFAGFGTTIALALGSVASVFVLVRSLRARVRIGAREGAIDLVRQRFIARSITVDAAEVTAVLVVGAIGRRRVALVGARNLVLAHAFDERFMDTPALVNWIADAVALMAAVASARAEGRNSLDRAALRPLAH